MKRIIFFLFIVLTSCNTADIKNNTNLKSHPNIHKDYHSVAHKDASRITHLELNLRIDFDSTIIKGVAAYSIERNGSDKIHFDIKDLEIIRVLINDPKNYRKLVEADFRIEKGNELGDELIVPIDEYTITVHIVYKTDPKSEALQWLRPEQTFNKKEPFLYSQGFPILTRTWIPIQDSPGIKISYNAELTIPRHLFAVMSANNPTKKDIKGFYRFVQKNPVPPYLIALAVGDISYYEVGSRCGIYAESRIIDPAYDEFEDLESMLSTIESTYGKYKWNKYNLLIMPPSFPYGGMENPQLSFITPTLIAGDKSLVNLIIHEMAHSWAGNLVTNATWNDFWLNEGITVYLERRIGRILSDNKTVELDENLAYEELLDALNKLDSNDTRLKLRLDDKRDPEAAMSSIAYEKGYFFLKELEKEIGVEKMDAFLTSYFDHFAFKSITTEDFLLFMQENLMKNNMLSIPIEDWVYSSGLPHSFTHSENSYFKEVDKKIALYLEKGELNLDHFSTYSVSEWVYFLKNVPDSLTIEQLSYLDEQFLFSASGNNEVKTQWYLVCIRNSYLAQLDAIDNFLMKVGRLKYLSPIYQAYINNQDFGLEKARQVYNNARSNYHFTSTQKLDKMMNYKKE